MSTFRAAAGSRFPRLSTLPFTTFLLISAIFYTDQTAQGTEKELTTTREACQQIAAEVAVALNRMGVDSLQVMAFEGVAAGPRIQQTIREMLAERNIDTKVETGFSLRGECTPFRDNVLKYNIVATLRRPGPNGQPIPVDEFQVRNALGEETTSSSLSVVVDSRADVIKATGTNTDNTEELGRGSTRAAIDAELVESFDEQNTNEGIESGVKIDPKHGVFPEKDSRFSVQLLLKQRGSFIEKEAYLHRGKPFVNFDFGDVIGIRIHNRSKEIVVIDVAVDGFSTFEFSKREPQLYAVRPGKHLDIKGWYRTNRKVSEFLIADVESSSAAKTNRNLSNIGVISVLVYPAWEDPARQPEYLITKRGDDGKQNAAMKEGEIADDNKTDVELYYDLETLLASIAIRYDVLVDQKGTRLPR
ncbi:hypothetical protein [Rubinisphaera margarita]|uniref:hypothetical protein n=1 Tax=Rubinisphaera margarita TaxID=2909586 RepID=UPI001EE8280A|nr:hypothetical protein [Rubinisphaera margarita]MCG6156051.1 hypothetical protein [Rubinisphaera margarita]